MLVKFPSLAKPDEIGYAYDSMAFTHSSTAQIKDYLRAYETYGDGLTQHSGDWGITREQFTDFCASCASYLAHERDIKLAENIMSLTAWNEPKPELIAFAASIIYSEKKRWYYSLQLQQKSTAESKRHDRRWFEVPCWADGSPEAVRRLLWEDWHDGIKMYAITAGIHDWCYEQGVTWDWPARVLGWETDFRKAREMNQAYTLMRTAAKALVELRNVEQAVEEFKPEPVEIAAETVTSEE